MSGFRAVFATTFRRQWRDKGGLFMMMAFPIILVLVLGTALGSAMDAVPSFDPIPLAVVFRDEGEGRQRLEAMLRHERLRDLVALVPFDTMEEARTAFEDREVHAILHTDPDFSERFAQGDGSGLHLVLDKSGNLSVIVVRSLVQAFTYRATAVSTLFAEAAAKGRLDAALTAEVERLLEDAGAARIRAMPLTAKGTVPTSFEYYAITMTVMITLYGGLGALDLMRVDILGPQGDRLRQTPLARGSLISGLIAATTATGFLQTTAVVLATSLLFQARWGDTIPQVLVSLAVILALVLFAQFFVIFLVLLTRDTRMANGLVFGFAITTTMVSGGYNNSMNWGAADSFLKTWATPSSLAQTALFGNLYGGDPALVLQCILLLFALALLLFAGSVLLGRRRLP